MTSEISRMYACACDRATVTDKKMKGVPQRCPNTNPFKLCWVYYGFRGFSLQLRGLNWYLV